MFCPKAPPQKRKAPLLKTVWRRFWSWDGFTHRPWPRAPRFWGPHAILS